VQWPLSPRQHTWEFSIFNLATQRWERFPGKLGYGERCTTYLAFDPTQYEVFLILSKDIGMFDRLSIGEWIARTACRRELHGKLELFLETPTEGGGLTTFDSMAPPMFALQVLSSSMREWHMMSFVREGKTMVRVTNVQTQSWFIRPWITRWYYKPKTCIVMENCTC
jgi:hypothetical protein